jgi:hypothetical protein
MNSIEEYINRLPKVSPHANYWMVRTNSGEYYDVFRKHGKIAISYAEIHSGIIKRGPTDRAKFYEYLAPHLEGKVEKTKIGLAIGQVYRFYKEIKKGDCVLIPNCNSEKVLIGFIKDDSPEDYTFRDNEEITCPNIHSRSVEWAEEKYRDEFNPTMLGLFYSHHAIVTANEYSDYINGAIHDIFIQESAAHLLIEVRHSGKIKARVLFELFHLLFNELEEYIDRNVGENALDDIDIRINLNSPGKAELFGKNAKVVTLVGMAVVLIAGGRFRAWDIDIGTNGVLASILAYINENAERKARVELIGSAMSELDVKDPKELLLLIQESRSRLPAPIPTNVNKEAGQSIADNEIKNE